MFLPLVSGSIAKQISGEIDYDKIIAEFGVDKITDDVIHDLKDPKPPIIRRGLLSHRGLGQILSEYDKGNKFALVSGRGPSESIHIGHLLPIMICKYFQDAYDVDFFLPLSDDEKFLTKNVSQERARELAKENMLDLIAVGLKPNKTFFLIDSYYPKIYNNAIQLSKKITYSMAKAVFGLMNEDNIGWSFYPAVQAAHILLPQAKEFGGRRPVLVPIGIDQDPFIRLSRDLAAKLELCKPSAVHVRFLRGLNGEDKMSASDPSSSIYLTDTLASVEKKAKAAFTGGQATVKEQKEKGANPDVCVVYQWLYYLFENSDKDMDKLYYDCRAGNVMCGECKQKLAKYLTDFVARHQVEREKARDKVDKFLIHDLKEKLPEY